MTTENTFEESEKPGKKARKVLSDSEKAFIASLGTETDYMKVTIDSKHPDAKVQHEPLQEKTELEVGQVEVEFSYPVVKDDAEANGVISAKGWSLVELINEILKANARSNRYQLTSAKYKPTGLSTEEAIENIVRDMVRNGIPEEFARAQVTNMFSAAKG